MKTPIEQVEESMAKTPYGILDKYAISSLMQSYATQQVSIATAEKDAEIVRLTNIKAGQNIHIAALQSEIDRLKSLVPEWVSVEDRLPETECLLLTASKKIITGDWYDGIWRSAGKNRWEEKITGGFELTSSLRKSDITHWMYLPQSPKAE